MSGGKIWRLAITILMTAMLVILGWFTADAALHFIAGDSDISPTFAEEWSKWVYRGTYLIASVFFGIAFGRFVFRKIEDTGARLEKMSARDKVALAGGLAVGILLSAIVSLPIIFTFSTRSLPIAIVLSLLLGVIITYLSIAAGWSLKEEIRFYIPPKETTEAPAVPDERFKLLDTNVIIDGRIADIARTGFVDSPIYVPGFILDELQHIADSSDAMRKSRGRRGLDVLKTMDVVVREYDRLAPKMAGEEVDARLVRLAKALNGSIITNDRNLSNVANIQGVVVLNINELANALKPRVLPGEPMEVTLVKEGKDPTQGVGYLDDGTMIVVENGRGHINETVEVVVSSVYPTQSGIMIFAHLQQNSGTNDGTNDSDGSGPGSPSRPGGPSGPADGSDFERGMRSYPRGGTRRPVRK